MRLRLLIAEDDKDKARRLQSGLLRYGIQSTAVAGEDLESTPDLGRYDVVLLAHPLRTAHTGLCVKVLRRMSKGEQIGIVVMSGPTYMPARERGAIEELGTVDGWVERPLRSEELRRVLVEVAAARGRGSEAGRAARTSSASVTGRIAGVVERLAEMFERSPVQNEVPTANVAPLPGGPWQGSRTIGDARAVSTTLIGLARARYTGVLTLQHKQALCRVGLLHGVVVGVWDNARDSLLAEQLVRDGKLSQLQFKDVIAHMQQRNQRLELALLQLGLVSAEDLVEALEIQACDRLIRCVGWSQGEMALDDARLQLQRLATGEQDLREAILTWFCLRPSWNDVQAWVRTHSGSNLSRTVDYDAGLASLAKIAPDSLLPTLLQGEPRSVRDILSSVTAEQVAGSSAQCYALWMAGMLHLDVEGEPPSVALPQAVVPDVQSSQVLDAEVARELRWEWLRVRDCDFYEVLDVSPAASQAELLVALQRYQERWGAQAYAGKPLGAVQLIAQELAALIQLISSVLGNEAARERYDQETQTSIEEDGELLGALDAEVTFTEGKLALQGGEVAVAEQAFHKALQLRPDDVDYVCHLGWARYLQAAEQLVEAVGLLKSAASAHPQALRPQLFLGRAAMLQGDTAEARRHLEHAARLCPDDSEVETALQQLLMMQG